jgi:hypothetical protein
LTGGCTPTPPIAMILMRPKRSRIIEFTQLQKEAQVLKHA